MTDLAARRHAFDGHNLFLQALLGLLSGSARVGALLAHHGGTPRGVAPVTVDDDPLLAAALGVVALRERLLLHVGTALERPAEHRAAGDDAPAPELRPLLR